MLQEVAVKLVKESFGDTYYGKAMDCIQALRSEAIKVSHTVLKIAIIIVNHLLLLLCF